MAEVEEAKFNCPCTPKASICLTLFNIILAKTNHIAKGNMNETWKYILLYRVRDTPKSNCKQPGYVIL